MIKVLLVEDEVIMRLAFQKMMDWDETGYTLVAAVGNGAEALKYIKENPVDIVVTDLIMPVMDGLELIEALRENGFPGSIFVLSNYTDFELVRRALTSGASDYMLKLNLDGESLRTQLDKASLQIKVKALPTYAGCKKEVRDALKYIHAHYSEKISLDDVASAVSLNRSYLCRLFRKETGVHMFGYINDLRMKKAAALIEEGKAYVREVAVAVGIGDQYFFTRVFKKYYGVSPSEYGKVKKTEG